MRLWRVSGMCMCMVLHIWMHVVLKQRERFPNVYRCFGDPSHKNEGSLAIGSTFEVLDLLHPRMEAI